MEKIDVFDYIERAATALDANAVGFAHAADKLTEFLERRSARSTRPSASRRG